MRLFSQRELKIFLLSVAVATIVAVLLVVIFSGTGDRKGKKAEITTGNNEYHTEEFDPEELIIPGEFTEVWNRDWVPFRERKKVWKKEESDLYWSDTKQVLLEVLEQQTVDTLMKNLSSSSSGSDKDE